jgi:hypothetical protein
MTEKEQITQKEFEGVYDEIMQLVFIENSFMKNWKTVVEFLESYSTYSTQLIRENQPKVSLYILIKLQTVCKEVLKKFPTELDHKREISRFFQELEGKSDSPLKINCPGIVKSLSGANSMKDITELKSSSGFAFYLVLEYYLQISNNIAFVSFKRNKIDKAI